MEGTHAPCHPTGILPTPRRSWTELVPEAVLRCPTYTIDGVPKLSLAKRYQERHIKELQYSLVGRISSVGDDGFDHAYALIRRAWRPEGDAKFSEIASSEFFVTFSLPSDYEKVHRSAPWMVDGHLVEVQPWWPGEFPRFRRLSDPVGSAASSSRSN